MLPVGIRGVLRGIETSSKTQVIAGCVAAAVGIVGIVIQGRIIAKGRYQIQLRRV